MPARPSGAASPGRASAVSPRTSRAAGRSSSPGGRAGHAPPRRPSPWAPPGFGSRPPPSAVPFAPDRARRERRARPCPEGVPWLGQLPGDVRRRRLLQAFLKPGLLLLGQGGDEVALVLLQPLMPGLLRERLHLIPDLEESLLRRLLAARQRLVLVRLRTQALQLRLAVEEPVLLVDGGRLPGRLTGDVREARDPFRLRPCRQERERVRVLMVDRVPVVDALRDLAGDDASVAGGVLDRGDTRRDDPDRFLLPRGGAAAVVAARPDDGAAALHAQRL